jgi:hypothetical protein
VTTPVLDIQQPKPEDPEIQHPVSGESKQRVPGKLEIEEDTKTQSAFLQALLTQQPKGKKRKPKWDSNTNVGKNDVSRLGGGATDPSEGLSAFFGVALSLAVVFASAIAGSATGGGR